MQLFATGSSPLNTNRLVLSSAVCKRCKRHAHDNHEHGSQQSQQTSFEVRFLHVNFSYSLKIYLKRFADGCPKRTRLLAQ